MGTKNHPYLPAAIVLLIFTIIPLHAAEKGGLLVDISKKTIARKDRTTPYDAGSSVVDRTLALKLDVKNNSTKDLPSTPVHYIVLIQRWGSSERENLERFEGNGTIEALRPANSTSVQLGEFHIGGHMHASSERHVDHIAGWKVVITRNGKSVEFTSGPTFETMNDRAKPPTARP